MLTLITVVFIIIFAVCMFLLAYGWDWSPWKCILFALACCVVLFLLVLFFKSVILKILVLIKAVFEKLKDTVSALL